MAKKRALEDDARGYEFDERENAEFARLVDAMRFVARAQLVLGVLLAAATVWFVMGKGWGIAMLLASQALFNLLAGQWALTSATSFRKVVDTQGSDIVHLMGALGGLKKMFSLQKTLILGVIAMVAVSAAVFVVTGPGGATSGEGAQGAPPAAPMP